MLAAELRPPEYWVEGLPTVDVQWDVGMYSPALPQVRGTPDVGLANMAIAEYAELYSFLPEEGSMQADLTSVSRLLTASMGRPQWWKQYPALGLLCWAWANVREGSDDMRRLATRSCR